MTNHPNRSRRPHTVTVVETTADGRITTREIATGLTYDQAARAAKREAGRKANFTKYGPNSVAFVGADITAVIAW